MERLFSPCTRDSEGGLEDFREGGDSLRELKLDISTEELLSVERAFTYADLYAILRNKDTVAWLTPHGSVVHARTYSSYYDRSYHYKFRFNVDGQHISAVARSSEALAEIIDVVRRLLLADVSEVYELELMHSCYCDEVFFNAPSFAHLVEQCQSLKALILDNITLHEDYCRVLGNISKPGLEIELKVCTIKGAAAEALAEIFGRNRGPTRLDHCYIDYSILANGLRRNSRLKTLILRPFDARAGEREFLAIAGALKENKGLVDLHLQYEFRVSDEAWGTICDSLMTHQTLQVLDLERLACFHFPPAVLKSRIQALVDMLQVNMSIHTIRLESPYTEHELFRRSVIPYLETNRLRPHVRAIQKARPLPYRAKVLGRALLAARTDANSVWMLLSGNAEVTFPPTTATTTAAVSLPITPTTNTDVSIAAATGGTSAANGDAPLGQKRKARL
jgi:hypothetical protein